MCELPTNTEFLLRAILEIIEKSETMIVFPLLLLSMENR